MDITAKSILHKLVPTNVPHATAIRGCIVTLITEHPEYAIGLMARYGSSLEQIPAHSTLTLVQCDDIISTTKTKHMVQLWAVPYMLALFTKTYQDQDLQSPAWRLMSGYLQVMFLLTARNDEHFKKINQLGTRIRIGLKTHHVQSAILTALIDMHRQPTTLTHVFHQLQSLESAIRLQETTGKDNHLNRNIGQIRLAYGVIVNDLAFIHKKRSAKSSSLTKRASGQFEFLPNLDAEAAPVRTWQPSINDKSNVSVNETQGDEDAIKLLDNAFRPSSETAKSAELQAFEVRLQARHSRRNQFDLFSNVRVLSVTAYQRLFAWLWLQLDEGDLPQQRTIAVILLSLLSGRAMTDIIEDLQRSKSQRHIFAHHGNTKTQTGHTSLKVKINVTPNHRGQLKKLRQSCSHILDLPLPYALQAMVDFKFTLDMQDIDAKISSVKADLELPILSRQHIESALSVIIKHHVGKSLHADLITAVDVKHCAPLYYTCMPAQSLLQTYTQALTILSSTLPEAQQATFRAGLVEEAASVDKRMIGSDMVLDNLVCQKFFQELALHAEGFNNKASFKSGIHDDNHIRQFNAYGLWLWHILQLLTGIRPVNDAPGLLNQFNFTQQLLWVSDKANKGNSREGRLIPLADFVTTAVQNYLTYLQRFAAQHNAVYPEYSLAINGILQSKRPLLNFFSFKPLGFVAYQPSRVRGLLAKFLPHQDNWLRHQLRSLLTDRADEALICAIFGHEHPDQELLHPFSSASLTDLKALKVHLDNIAQDLALQQVKVI